MTEQSGQHPVDSTPYQVVARRYRPALFEDLIGQESVATALTNAITTGRIGHAYLFTGARGVGKTSSARIFAKALNCVHGPTPNPCNVCDICLGIATGEDVDVLEIDGASNRGIGEIQMIRKNASLRPSRARFKIYIIDEVHAMTKDAFNALLKTLEEPPEHVKFIFCTTEPTRLPITILSRCQRFDFAQIESTSIAHRLEQIIIQEGSSCEAGVCEMLARRAAGSMRDAQSLLEQLLSFAPKNIRLVDIHSMLGTVDDRMILALLRCITEERTGDIFPLLTNAIEQGVDFGVLVDQLLGVFRDLMLLSGGAPAKLIAYTAAENSVELTEIANQLGIDRIIASLQILDQTCYRMRYSTMGQVLLELALVRLAMLSQYQSMSQLIAQLKTGSLKLPVNPSSHPPRPSPLTPNPSPNTTNTPNPSPLPLPLTPNPIPLTPQSATEIWQRASGSIGSMMLSMNAGACQSVEWMEPNRMVLLFPADRSASHTFCVQERDKLHSFIQPFIAGAFELDLRLLEAPPLPAKPAAPKGPTMAEMMAVAENNPVVQKVKELFNANIIRVCEEN